MKNSSGFSLIELLIVISIVGILTSIAFGVYRENVISANRTEGRAALQTAAGTLEKCRSLYGSYNNVSCSYADFTSESDLYDIAGAITSSTFMLTATPVVGGAQVNDSDCTSLTLDNTGIKSGTGADPEVCW